MKVKVINKSKNPLPKHETLLSAGMDVRGDFSLLKGSYAEGSEIGFGCVVDKVDENGKPTQITINPMGRILIPTGLSMEIPAGYEVQVRPRSGLALKHGITLPNSPGTIDAKHIN